MFNRDAVFISGLGSNLKALVDANPHRDFRVFSQKKCSGLVWAKKRGLEVEVVKLLKDQDWASFAQKLNALSVGRVFLLGFMKVVPDFFLDKIQAEVVNLHPSVLPGHKGLNAIEKSFESRTAMGCTLHEVVEEVDAGKILLQKSFLSEAHNEFSEFKYKIHGLEQRLVGKYFDLDRGKNG